MKYNFSRKIFCVLFLILIPLSLFAKTSVYDYAKILYEEDKELLESKISEIENAHNNKVAFYIVTVESLPETSFYQDEEVLLQNTSEDFFNEHGFGYGAEKNGVMIFLTMEERMDDICVHGDTAFYAFTDLGQDKAREAAESRFEYDAWYSGFKAFLEKCDKFMTMAENEEPFDVGTMYFDLEIFIISLCVALFISSVVALIIIFTFKHKMSNVRNASDADSYVDVSNAKITESNDVFLHVTETRTPIVHEDSNHGGGHSGGTSVNSSGFSHSSGHF